MDAANLTVKYGDSFGWDGQAEVVEAVLWWLQSHVPSPFKTETLRITPQTDGFSCGVYAINAVRHAVLADAPLLQLSKTAVHRARAEMFVCAAKRNTESVSQSLLH